MIGFRRYKSNKKAALLRHPIVLVLATAVLSFIGSVAGVYMSAPILVSQFIEQKNYENKSDAYEHFLQSMSADTTSASIKLIGLNQMVRNVSTDDSIQRIEDNIALLSSQNSSDELFLNLLSNMQALKLHGSSKVDLFIDDFISVLLGNDYFVNWELHDSEVRDVRKRWVNNNGAVYGWIKKVSDDERAKFIILSAQYVELVKLLKNELSHSNT